MARELGRPRFVSAHDSLFLVKPPSVAADGDDGWKDRFAFHTLQLDPRMARAAAEIGPLAGESIVAPVRKRPENPFPDRISVGRARNCDIVFRVPTISKLHAEFLVEGGQVTSVRDLGSANGMRVNGKVLAAKERRPVRPGAHIELGALALELVNGTGLYELVA